MNKCWKYANQLLQFYSPYQKQWQKDITRYGEGRGEREKEKEEEEKEGSEEEERQEKQVTDLDLSQEKKLPSELKTHDEEIASMKQDHWAETKMLWEEMER